MLAFIVRRLMLAIPTLIGVMVVVFLLLYVAPGDPVQDMVGERADAETIARLREELHLDEPVAKQFVMYAGGVLKGDLGNSYITQRPIIQDIKERFPKTLLLAGTAMLLASVLGITIGVLSARNPGGWFDRLGLGLAYLGISFPVYWVGLILILIFAVNLKWLPPSGYGGIEYLILPALALGSRSIAFLARVTRSSMLEILGGDFVRTARAKGIPERAVVFRHALRNALLPVVTLLGLALPTLLGGAVFVENVFAWPGMGTVMTKAISMRDYPLVVANVIAGAALVVAGGLLADLLSAVADPRLRDRA